MEHLLACSETIKGLSFTWITKSTIVFFVNQYADHSGFTKMTFQDRPRTPFFGREQELRRLMELTTKTSASLVVIKGRRRIGKSRLIYELASRLPRYRLLRFQGLPPSRRLTQQQERDDFAQQLAHQLQSPTVRADDWNTLLWALAERTAQGRCLIVLDEINWLGRQDATFLGKLKNAWDLYFSQNPQLILILSGSMSSWIERDILHHTGFLGRVSVDMTLDELPLPTCNLFWGEARHRITAYEKLRLLTITGGIPRYLEEINPALSADANIQRMCFSSDGFLFSEFDNIFNDLFTSRGDTYRRLLKALADGPLDLEGIYDRLGINKTGKIIEYADELVQTGLLARDYTWNLRSGAEGKLSKLRLSDNYVRFYLKFIEPIRTSIRRRTRSRLPSIDTALGLQLENMVLKNRHAIFQRLGIDPNDVVYDNPFFQRKTQRCRGCQIDYLIQTRDRTLYVCEIRQSRNPISSTVADEVAEKISRLQIPRHTSYRPVLIHVGEIAESLEDRRYFSAMIDFGELLR